MRASRSRGRQQQRGISFIGLLFVAIVVACVGIVVAQVIPTLIEYQAINKAANKAKEGSTVPEVRAIFDRARSIDDFQSVDGKDLDIHKDGEKVVVAFAYEREIHLFGPAFLVLKYKGQSQ
jgi:sensor histidine kinase regulating citrate/malate metabolism